MADPATIAMIGMGASAAGAGVSAAGSLAQGQAQSDTYNYKAAVATRNTQIDEQNAEYAVGKGETDAQISGMQSRFTQGKIKTSQAAGNLDVNFGSNRQVQDSARQVGWEDQEVIRSNAAMTAFGYRTQAANDTDQSNIYSMSAKNAIVAGDIGAASSILGGVSSVSSKWLQGNQVGAFGGKSSGGGFIGGSLTA